MYFSPTGSKSGVTPLGFDNLLGLLTKLRGTFIYVYPKGCYMLYVICYTLNGIITDTGEQRGKQDMGRGVGKG